MQRIGEEAIAESPALRGLVERMKGLSPEEIERRLSSPNEGELSDEELELLSGGMPDPSQHTTYCGKCGAGPMSMAGWVAHWNAYHD